MKKILVIKPSSIGDIIHGLLVAQSIRDQWPGCAITWVARERFAPLVRGCPTVDHTLVFNRHGSLSGFVKLIRDMRRETYDYVLDFQGLARSALMTVLARGRVKLGRSDAREGAALTYPRRAPLPKAGARSHAVEILLEFLPLMGLQPKLGSPLRLPAEPLPPPDKHLAARRPIVLAPHSRLPDKEWGGFAELTQLILARDPDLPVVWFSHKECTSPPGLDAKPNFHNLTGRTTLGQMVGLVQAGRVVVCNDSGPMHIAAALRRPLVACFGPTSPQLYGPYPPDPETQRVLCAPGGDLARLEVAEVYAAVTALLKLYVNQESSTR